MKEIVTTKRDNDTSFYRPYTQGVDPRLVQPAYQKYIGKEPRFFNAEQKAQALERQGYICPICSRGIDMHYSECHHCVQWQSGGSSAIDNLVVVHKGECHRTADYRAQVHKDLIVGGTIYDAEPSQFRSPAITRN